VNHSRRFVIADVWDRDSLAIGAALLLAVMSALAAWSDLAFAAAGELRGIPALAVGFMLWASFAIGVGGARLLALSASGAVASTLRSWHVPRVALITVVIGITLGAATVVASLVQHIPIGTRLLIVLAAALMFAAGAGCARRWPTVSPAQFVLVGEVLALWTVFDAMT